MTREEAEDYIYQSYLKKERAQDYQKKDAEKRNPQLTKALLQEKSGTPCVVVTGSKGKGSVASMIAQFLKASFDVGLMTSPHIIRFNERFKVNGNDISDEDFIATMEQIKPAFDDIEHGIVNDSCISPMGIQAALALTYFKQRNTSFNVFECGKGAKYDDVNNITHQYAVINTIFLEHTRELGATLQEIAEDKAHVITKDTKVVFVAQNEIEVINEIQKRVKLLNCDNIKPPIEIKYYGTDFTAEQIEFGQNGMYFDIRLGDEHYNDITIPLLGEHQARNAALALALCREVLGENDFKKIFSVGKDYLSKLQWPGRMEILSKEPLMILDACINRASARIVKQILLKMQLTAVTAVIGIPDDKDYLGVAQVISPIAEKIILTKSQNPHYRFTTIQKQVLQQELLKELPKESSLDTESYIIETDCVQNALKEAEQMDYPIIILGTTSVVGEIENLSKRSK